MPLRNTSVATDRPSHKYRMLNGAPGGGFSNCAYASSSFFWSLLRIRVTLLAAVWLMPRGTSRLASVELAVNSIALASAYRSEAAIFGFVRKPRSVKGDAAQVGRWVVI